MAQKKVVWSIRAQQDRLEILEYWINRNKSKRYSTKLLDLFESAVELITQHPEIGKPTDLPRVRTKIVREYLIIYQTREDRLEILTIWDNRRNPTKLTKRLLRNK